MVLGLEGWPFAGWEDMPAAGQRQAAAPGAVLRFRVLAVFPHPAVGALRRKRGSTRSAPSSIATRQASELGRDARSARPRVSRTACSLSLGGQRPRSLAAQLTRSRPHETRRRAAQRSMPGEINRLNIIADNFGARVRGRPGAGDDRGRARHRGGGPRQAAADVRLRYDLRRRDDPARPAEAGHGVRRSGCSKTVRQGLVRFASHAIWSAPQFFDRLPAEELGTGHRVLTVLKGDLNFRRALGDVSDRHRNAVRQSSRCCPPPRCCRCARSSRIASPASPTGQPECRAPTSRWMARSSRCRKSRARRPRRWLRSRSPSSRECRASAASSDAGRANPCPRSPSPPDRRSHRLTA